MLGSNHADLSTAVSALLLRLNKDYKKISMTILGVVKISVSHTRQGLQRLSEMELASA
jgi:hypothetical protein